MTKNELEQENEELFEALQSAQEVIGEILDSYADDEDPDDEE